jgi:hypothetical protein
MVGMTKRLVLVDRNAHAVYVFWSNGVLSCIGWAFNIG